MPPLHAPSRRGSTSASLQHTLCAHASGGMQPRPTHRGVSIATHTGAALILTLVAVLAGARARHQREMTSQLSHERPVHPARAPLPSQRGPHLSCPCAAHHPCYAPSCRQDGAAEQPQSDAMDVDLTLEARPHAHPPLRRPAPPASFLGLLRTQR